MGGSIIIHNISSNNSLAARFCCIQHTCCELTIACRIDRLQSRFNSINFSTRIDSTKQFLVCYEEYTEKLNTQRSSMFLIILQVQCTYPAAQEHYLFSFRSCTISLAQQLTSKQVILPSWYELRISGTYYFPIVLLPKPASYSCSAFWWVFVVGFL